MDRSDLVRLRWRLTGAWQWPSFVVLTVVDAAVIHWLPPVGDSEGLVGGWLIALVLSILAVCLLTPPLGLLLRRASPGLPRAIAKNYAGAATTLLLTLALLGVGLAHRATVSTDGSASYDATLRAEAWIGDHAPQRFLANLHRISTVQIQPPLIYRSCVKDLARTRSYCVVVNRSRPWGTSVRYDGSEPNSLLTQGSD